VAGTTDEFAFVRLRYKLPDEEESRLIETPVPTADGYSSLDNAPRDARFAAAVAAFGQKLQRSGYTDRYSYDEIIALAQAAKGDDPYGDRAEFINLVRAAAKIDRESGE
jgi:Ca-activated chloride channel family protein